MIMKKDITRFGITIVILAIMLIVVDFAVGFIADRVVDKMPNYSGQIAKDNYRLHRMDAEIVIIGSSRGSHHYVTSQLSDSIEAYTGKKYTIYNAAIDGKFANSNCCAAEMIISRYKPKLVIFDIPESQLRSTDVSTDLMFSSPFYWKDTIVRRYFDNLGLKERLLMKSNLYRYNGKLIRIASSFLRPKDKDDGYVPLYGTTIDTSLIKERKKEISGDYCLNTYSESNFAMVLKKYAFNEVPLVIACSPAFMPTSNNMLLKDMCNKYNTPFIDIYDTPYFNEHPELFKDAVHLNDDGAHVYTELFFEKLKPYLDCIKK